MKKIYFSILFEYLVIGDSCLYYLVIEHYKVIMNFVNNQILDNKTLSSLRLILALRQQTPLVFRICSVR